MASLSLFFDKLKFSFRINHREKSVSKACETIRFSGADKEGGGSCGVIARYGVIYPETLENIHCVYLKKGVQDMCVSSPVVAVAGRLGSNYPGHTRAARKKKENGNSFVCDLTWPVGGTQPKNVNTRWLSSQNSSIQRQKF
jgi:hypothetical protein